MQNLRDYQQRGVALGTDFARTATAQSRLLLAAPTGTGKSYIIRALLDALPGWVCITPSLDIAAGMLEKQGIALPATDNALADVAAQHAIYTPLRFRNALLNGTQPVPRGIIEDESHHDSSETHANIDELCDVPKIGVTATPYRGTPRGTLAFRAKWGDPQWLITYPEAAKRGVLALPRCETWPLVDDDLVEVSNGELVVSQIVGATRSRLQDIADRCSRFFDASGKPDRSTVFAFPSGEIADEFQTLCQQRSWATCMITQGTPRIIRREIYGRVAAGTHALINVKVVGEGVDLPLHRFVDCSPTLSPVLWMQRLGRITRPSAEPPEYICTNRNLMRHYYLLDGALPPVFLASSIAAFNGLGNRAGARAFGLEGIGKLRPINCELSNGLQCQCYSVTQTAAGRQTQYFVIVHPSVSRPIWAHRTNQRDGEAMVWGKWQLCDPPAELTGFKSLPNNPLTEKQAEWWKRAAPRHGLAATEPTTKLFPVLPVLSQLELKLC